jgi:hypothetical protein
VEIVPLSIRLAGPRRLLGRRCHHRRASTRLKAAVCGIDAGATFAEGPE